jgi:hypothetical protein
MRFPQKLEVKVYLGTGVGVGVGVGASTRRAPAASPTTGFAGVVTAGANEFVGAGAWVATGAA